MAILLCPECKKRMINQKILDAHLVKTHGIGEAPVPEPVAPPPVVDDKITLHFAENVEVGINGKWYRGKEIVAPNIKVASEIVRICRDAYGPSILNY